MAIKDDIAVSAVPNAHHDDEKDDVYDSNVPVRYRGTSNDKRDMNMLGKRQVLRRNFKFVTMLAFASTVMASWEVLLPLFTFVLTDGGTPALFWGFIIVTCGQLLVYASIAECASMSPTAGGAYHWVSEFAPPKAQKLLSYLVGWLSAIGWQVYLAGVAFMVGSIIQALIALNDESYTPKPWHATLLTIATITFSIVFNTVLAAKLPLLEGTISLLHIAGLFAIIIPLWTLSPRLDARTALLEFTNEGGWPSNGLATMIGLTTPLSCMIGYDCSVHMSEETIDASITLPRAIMWSLAWNATLAFLMAVTLIFTLGEVDSLFGTTAGQLAPFIQLFYNGTQSYGGTNTMVAIVIIMLTACCISEVATASRQLWSFARDEGLPFSGWLAKVNPRLNIPLQSIAVSVVVTALLSCINLGSYTALNAINSLGGVSILSSYWVTIACLIYRRTRGPPLPPRRWSLGKAGLFVNVAAILYLTPMWFFAFWPLENHTTPKGMNWSSTMFGGLIIFALIFYFVKAKHVYTGPVVLVKRVE
ncbi:amino acid transporter [Polyplosphaeria fusca]|uniref:Amino acid transporter n=1 Tax=Polyplosphaeria fusca TaxID=682080 RepID=A0A9P4UX12_9PLEO|nr:amino acid transporter [Polyplosphaeria fusca]